MRSRSRCSDIATVLDVALLTTSCSLFGEHMASNESLTTAGLAERAGMSAGTLRMWESRYGFPSPHRLPGGHHRYSSRDAEMLQQVLRLREQGLSIPAAIARARSIEVQAPASIFAGLRAARPDLQPFAVHKRALLSISRALEDEYCAQASPGLLIASFQRARFYRHSERRWRELSRTAQAAFVLADFDAVRSPTGGPIEVPIDRGDPIAREWTLIIDAPGAHACLAAWERPTTTVLPDAERRFELIWSFEPEVVGAARAVACALIAEIDAKLIRRIPAPSDEPLPASPPELRFAAALAHRMIGYLATMP
jgi:DICT domain-containing protein